MKSKALIIGIKGTKLTKREKILLKNEKPWGIILFKRNLQSFTQIKSLTKKIKLITKNKNFPIIIDEEGETVSRLKEIINHKISANFFGKLYNHDRNFTLKLLKHYIYSICRILNHVGINLNTIPVLDVLRNNTNKVIGNRSFSKDKKIVKDLGDYYIKYLHLNKIIGIIKHIPGHGASQSDSHKKLPRVRISSKKLSDIDFYPFKFSKAKLAMTAHILFTNLDRDHPATHSKKIIKNVIRKKLNFKGILMSDDISMKALKYDLVTNAKKSIDAGCNLVLYCSGKTNENFKLIKSLPNIDEFTSKKTSEIFKFLR